MAVFADIGASTWGSGEGVPWGSYLASGTVTGAAVTLGVGWWFVLCGAHNTVQHNYNPGTSSAAAVAASGAGMVFSDGATTVILNDFDRRNSRALRETFAFDRLMIREPSRLAEYRLHSISKR